MAVAAVSQAAFHELKARGDRALVQSQRAMQDFRTLSDEYRSLLERIDQIHHHRRWTFEANLAFFRAEESPRRVTQ